MPYRLLKGVYAVRCRHEHCPFYEHVEIEHEILGVTEEDVRSEAYRMARDQASVKHDSIHGRRHGLEAPEIHTVSGFIQRIGGGPAEARGQRGVLVRRFQKGEVILRKGQTASAVCEVLEGSAYPEANKPHRYRRGDCFGVAALVPNRRRLSDVVAGRDGTTVAFYDLGDLRQSEPVRAARVVSMIMEDTLHVVDELSRTVTRLRGGKGRHPHQLAS